MDPAYYLLSQHSTQSSTLCMKGFDDGRAVLTRTRGFKVGSLSSLSLSLSVSESLCLSF